VKEISDSSRPCFILWLFILEALVYYLILGLCAYWLWVIFPIDKQDRWHLSCIIFSVLYSILLLTAIVPGLLFLGKALWKDDKNPRCLNITAFFLLFFQLTVLFMFLKPSYLLSELQKEKARDFQFMKGLF